MHLGEKKQRKNFLILMAYVQCKKSDVMSNVKILCLCLGIEPNKLIIPERLLKPWFTLFYSTKILKYFYNL